MCRGAFRVNIGIHGFDMQVEFAALTWLPGHCHSDEIRPWVREGRFGFSRAIFSSKNRCPCLSLASHMPRGRYRQNSANCAVAGVDDGLPAHQFFRARFVPRAERQLAQSERDMNVQNPTSFISEAKRIGAVVDVWPLLCQCLQGALSVSQTAHSGGEVTLRLNRFVAGLRPLVEATGNLIQNTDRVTRLLESLPDGPLDRPFAVGRTLVDLEGKDLREFNSLLSALCLKTSSAHNWAVMVAQHHRDAAEQIRVDVASLGSIESRLSRLYAGSSTNRQVLNDALDVLGTFYESMNRILLNETN